MNQKKKNGLIKHLDFLLLDILCIELSYWLSFFLRHPGLFHIRNIHAGGTLSLYWRVNIIIIIFDFCYVALRAAYKNILKRSIWNEIRSVLVHNIVVWVAAMTYLYVTQQAFLFSRSVFLTSFVFSVFFMFGERVTWKRVVRGRLKKGKHLSYILIITTRDKAKEMIRKFQKRMYNGFNMLGFVITDPEEGETQIERLPIVCAPGEVLEYIRTRVVDEVMINVPERDEKLSDIIHTLLQMGVIVHIGLDYEDQELPNRVIERIGGFTFLTTSINTMNNGPAVVKRLIDIFAGLIGCAATGIIFLFIAPLIYKASPGPIFYRQKRIGKNGRVITIYKFRSMYPDADERKKELMAQNEMKGQVFKISNDPRIIKTEKGPGKDIGNFIRRTSLDEFPQFLNILRGDMSLVGTRPPTVDEYEEYDLHHKIRLSMKPGLTGLWQVSGRSQISDFEEIVRLDVAYIENWSLRLDFEIIRKTFRVVLGRNGAK